MIAQSTVSENVGNRVVLTCESNLSFAGILQPLHEVDDKPGILLKLDPRSGFCVWCPLEFAKSLLVVPISEAPELAPRESA